MERFSLRPSGPFSLDNENQYFGGWPTLSSDPKATVMAFPVEGWRTPAGVVVRQDHDGIVHGEVHGLADLRTLGGVGAFIGQGILIRGAGLPNEISDDEVSVQAFQHAYGLSAPPGRQEMLRIAEAWRPYRAWAMVLLHMWLRRDGGVKFQRTGRRPAGGSGRKRP